jgi:ferritin
MISEKVRKLLEAQIGHEFAASQGYLGASTYFASQGLEGWAGFFSRQSDEERGHALKIVKFLTDTGSAFKLPAIGESKTSFKGALEIAEWALKNEQGVTKQFQTMAATALAEKDFTSFQFVQWFIEEQVEEEASMEHLIMLIKSGINLFQAQAFLPAVE